MAESADVSAVKVFNYICGSSRVFELSHLLNPPSPLAKKSTVIDVISWFETQNDPNNGLVLVKNERGEEIGMRIDLKKQMCLNYAKPESCKLGMRCKFWHLCKEFIEGTCKGNCGRSHDFHDKDNKAKTVELGFEGKPNAPLKNIVAGSFLQVCRVYLTNGCCSENCPYLHICANAVRATACECILSHDFSDRHNKSILGQYGFKPPRTLQMDVVRCNILVPKQQKPFEASANQSLSRQPISRGNKPGIPTKSQTPSQVKNGAVSLVGLCQGFAKAEIRAPTQSAIHHHAAVTKDNDSLIEKVFNDMCSKGGLCSLQDLLQHPSPLARKFEQGDAKIWLQVNAQPEQGQKIILLENQCGEIVGARLNSRRKLCLHYSKGCKSLNNCQFWHICKGYLEGTCPGGCGLSHDFHDDGNIKKLQKIGIENHQGGTVRNIISHSLPQVCLLYLQNAECSSSHDCPYLHICSLAVQGNSCSCGLSHQLNDEHNAAILKQFDLDPQKTKYNIMQCNILIPKRQKSFREGKPVSASSSLSLRPAPLMSLQVAPQGDNNLGSQSLAPFEKKQKQRKRRPRQRKKRGNQPGEPCEESHANDVEDESSDSDNEDVLDKPDLYSSSKFVADPSPNTWQENISENPVIQGQTKKEKKDTMRKKQPKNPSAYSNTGSTDYDQVSGMGTDEVAEGNLINLSDEVDDEWQESGGGSLDDFLTFDPLSQVDDLLFNLSPSNIAESLSQDSSSFDPSDQHSSESHSEKKAVSLVFKYICTEHNGEVPFALISQHQELFPTDTIDIAAWFRKHSKSFMIIENSDGVIESVRAFSPKARICFRYLMTKEGCRDPKCFRYHVCKRYLANGSCRFRKNCNHCHSLKTPHNKNITMKMRLNNFSEEQLRVLIAASVPEVCLDYNNNSGRCKRGLRCNAIHVCKHFVMMGKCKRGAGCPLTHESELKDPHAKLVLDKYNLTSVPAKVVFRILLVRNRGAPSTRETVEQPGAAPSRQKREVPNMQTPQYICLDFLLGHCSKQELCDHYHYSMPYMWQYKDPSNEQADSWKAFTENENEAIERQFCDVNVTVKEMEHIMIAPPPFILIDPGEGRIKVNFDEMNAETGFGHVQLRRLSTKSAVLPTDHALSTQWVWYWLDHENSWREYGSEVMNHVKQDQIESSFIRGDTFFRFKVRGEDHKLFFHKTSMYQQSTKPPINIRRVRRRPVFRSKSDMQQLQSPLELPIPLEPETPQSPVTSAPGSAPSHWTSLPDNMEFTRVPLLSSSDEFKLAESLFRLSISENKASIVSIERVQNPFMWKKYAVKKEQMEKRALIKDSPVNEKLLFHGTDAQNVDNICEENIDCRAPDEDRAAQFGQGAYFTEEAALSNLYCRQDSESFRYMFLAEVLVGASAKGEPSMRRPPVKSESEANKKERYDSCVDNVFKPTIFVLFDSDQYYPSFLIKYKTKSKVVC